jgi:hypothetical protein
MGFDTRCGWSEADRNRGAPVQAYSDGLMSASGRCVSPSSKSVKTSAARSRRFRPLRRRARLWKHGTGSPCRRPSTCSSSCCRPSGGWGVRPRAHWPEFRARASRLPSRRESRVRVPGSHLLGGKEKIWIPPNSLETRLARLRLRRHKGAGVPSLPSASGRGLKYWKEAIEVYRRYGKGRHRASLNLGDCLADATAKLAAQPLLCTGPHFAQTDLRLA